MMEVPAIAPNRLLEALRDRQRTLEIERACIGARLDEIEDTIAALTSRPRGRPRAARTVEAPVQPELAAAPSEPETPPEAA